MQAMSGKAANERSQASLNRILSRAMDILYEHPTSSAGFLYPPMGGPRVCLDACSLFLRQRGMRQGHQVCHQLSPQLPCMHHKPLRRNWP